MAKKVYITGDTHGMVLPRLEALSYVDNFVPEETMLIILGDAGFNYYLGKRDKRLKREVEEKGVYIYCVRGNHEARPSESLGMHRIYDDNVGGTVWIEDDYPHIRYFCEWGLYEIQGLTTLVIGGAYSVDKFYRLERGFRWFENEQLHQIEMDCCLRNMKELHTKFDLVLTHTCPLSFQPTDLFLGFIDQSSVDNSMEKWMEKAKDELKWNIWLFGHYHADRIEWPHVEQFYTEIELLDDIIKRWKQYDETGELDWWLPLAPRMKKIMEEQNEKL